MSSTSVNKVEALVLQSFSWRAIWVAKESYVRMARQLRASMAFTRLSRRELAVVVIGKSRREEEPKLLTHSHNLCTGY